MDLLGEHWNAVYASKQSNDLSWFEPRPTASLGLIEEWAPRRSGVVDVGAGTSTLVDQLLENGFEDLTVLDVSSRALTTVRGRLGGTSRRVQFVVRDVLSWTPARTFNVWHDRAVFHFLTDHSDQDRYVTLASEAVAKAGVVVLSTFADDGPETCSGLPVRRYTAHELQERFSAFELVHAERLVHRTPWESSQAFTSVVLQRSGNRH